MTVSAQSGRAATLDKASAKGKAVIASAGAPRVFMMDLLATVPYYTAYLSRALLEQHIKVKVGSITYYLDRTCFSGRGLVPEPGLLNVVGRYPLPARLRQGLKLLELGANLAALTLRSLFRPAEIVHVQYLPLLRWPVPMDEWFVRFSRRRGSKVVLTVHDLLPHDTADRYRAVFHALYRRTDALICHSDHIKGRLRAEFDVPDWKIHVIPHGPFFYDQAVSSVAGTRSRYGIAPDHAIVLWQGIIFPYKGLDLLLEAWRTVEHSIATAHLVVVGTGAPDLLAVLRAQVRDLGLTRVTLDLRFASTDELVDVYRAADLVIYPYRAITTSGALATGLALGKAIVASDLPVFRELLTDGENALLVPPGDTSALADAILTLLKNADLREQFMRRVQAMNFGAQSWQAIAAQTIGVYETVLGSAYDSPRPPRERSGS